MEGAGSKGRGRGTCSCCKIERRTLDLVLRTGVALKPSGRRAARDWEGSPLKKEHGRLERAAGILRGIGKGTSWFKMQAGSAEQGGGLFAWCVCICQR